MKEITSENLYKVIEDSRYVAGVLNLIEGVLMTPDGREMVSEQAFWVVLDAGMRMKGTLEILEEIA